MRKLSAQACRRTAYRRVLRGNSSGVGTQLMKAGPRKICNLSDLLREGAVEIDKASDPQLLRAAVPRTDTIRLRDMSTSSLRAILCAELNSDSVCETSDAQLLPFTRFVTAQLAKGQEEFSVELKKILSVTELTSLPVILRMVLESHQRSAHLVCLCLRRFMNLSQTNFATSYVGHTLALLCLRARQESQLPYWSDELSMLLISCLRYCPWFALLDAFGSIKSSSCQPALAAKFLSCGAFVCHTTNVLGCKGASVVTEAAALAMGGSGSPSEQEALYHACAILAAQGSYDEVFNLYQRFPGLKTSRSFVESCARQGNLQQALFSLHHLASSRTSWTSFPVTVASCCKEVARAVGCHGDCDDVPQLIMCINRFRAPSVKTSVFLEEIIFGLCERVSRIKIPQKMRKDSDEASKICTPIGQIVEAVMKHSTANMNRGPLYRLLSECLNTELLEIPLICAVVGGSATEKNRFLPLSSDSSTMTWTQRSALALARDRGRMKIFEELAMTWKLPLAGHARTMPSTVLWNCPNCRLPNSDRFSICGECFASRMAMTPCDSCGFSQEVSNKVCVVCSAELKASTKAAATALLAWNCASCGEKNDSSRLSICSFCKKPKEGAVSSDESVGRCALCKAPKSSGNQPYCKQCGLREAVFVNEKYHYLWLCGQCKIWVPSLENHCTSCGIFEQTAACIIKPWDQSQKCNNCSNNCTPLAIECSSCKSLLQETELAGLLKPPTSVLCCPKCTTVNPYVSNVSCSSCGSSLASAERLVVRERQCSQCRELVSMTNPTAVCPKCAALLPHVEWSRSTVTSSLKSLQEFKSQMLVVKGLELLVANISRAFNVDSNMEGAICLVAGIQTKARGTFLLHRRTLALCRKLLLVLSPSTAATSAPLAQDVCSECLGSHKHIYCAFNYTSWYCNSCTTMNTNEGLGRYFCSGCHEMRPEFADEQVTETWECKSCKRAVVELESYCIHCGAGKQGDEKVLPLAPAVCGQCETLHLESICHGCPKHSHLHDGVVCMVAKRYALIRPATSNEANDRVFVRENLFARLKSKLHERQEVKYRFVVMGGRKLATSIQ